MDERQKEGGDNQIFIALVGAFVLPLVVAWHSALTLAGRANTWKLRFIPAKYFFLCPAFTLLGSYLIVRTAKANQIDLELKNLMLLVALLWIIQIPSAVIVFSIRLRKVATDFQQGRVEPNKSEAIRDALFTSGVNRARNYFKKLNYLLPISTEKGQAVIGIVAETKDARYLMNRFSEPNRHILDEMNSDGLLTIPLAPNSPSHHLVIGATGSGKSTLLSRMALSALHHNFRVVILDFKGGKEEAELFLSLGTYGESRYQTKCWPGDPLDLWRGTASDVADRVIGFLPAPAPGGGEYYRARLMRAIKAVTERTSAGVPRSADELISRIRNAGAFADDQEDREALMRKGSGGTASGEIADALGSYLDPLRGSGAYATNGGWSWSDKWDLAVISLDSTREAFKRLGAAILHDFDAWSRSPERFIDPRPVMLIVDEGGVLQTIHGAPALTNLVARGRSARISVVIAAQTLSSLGVDGEQIMATGTTRWLGRSPDPEIMAMAAGTRSVIETGHQDGKDGYTGVRSMREQKALLVDPDLVRRLPNFVWITSEHGRKITGFCPPVNYKP